MLTFGLVNVMPEDSSLIEVDPTVNIIELDSIFKELEPTVSAIDFGLLVAHVPDSTLISRLPD